MGQNSREERLKAGLGTLFFQLTVAQKPGGVHSAMHCLDDIFWLLEFQSNIWCIQLESAFLFTYLTLYIGKINTR